jgi:hypothetical protein
MDLLQMIAELRAEQQQIDAAILVVERLAAGTRGKRRGRPPKWMSAASAEADSPAPQEKRVVSAAARKRIAEAQKKRWAAKRAQTNQ